MTSRISGGAPSSVSIIVPLWNEGRNIDALVSMLAASETVCSHHAEVVLVNNGSADDTGKRVDAHASQNPWIRPLHLEVNQNYGGGILAGAQHARGNIICFIPGDLQYLGEDLDGVVSRLILHHAAGRHTVLVKGNRTKRLDSQSMKFVSGTYTSIVNAVLGLGIKDVNGLPKGFHRDLLQLLPAKRMKTFVLDAQLLFVGRQSGWDIEEVDVTFAARREGVSSWSGKRFQTYLRSLRQLFEVRAAGCARVQK